MNIKIQCPTCKQDYSVDESLIGEEVECAACSSVFVAKKKQPIKLELPKKEEQKKPILLQLPPTHDSGIPKQNVSSTNNEKKMGSIQSNSTDHIEPQSNTVGSITSPHSPDNSTSSLNNTSLSPKEISNAVDTQKKESDNNSNSWIRYFVAILACFFIIVLFNVVGVLVFKWKHGGGIIPTIVLLVVLGTIWKAIVPSKKDNDK